jgi:hypothetical protein
MAFVVTKRWNWISLGCGGDEEGRDEKARSSQKDSG